MDTARELPPILVIIFNRPDKVRKLIEALEKVRPPRIYVAADGPRPHTPEDETLCNESRALFTNLPWKCEVRTLFQHENLGCKRGVTAGIRWFFEQVPEGIILEDDCIPTPAFFSYCRELLARYRDTHAVMHIAGSTFLPSDAQMEIPESYFFSHISLIWGWATWRRAWNTYDIDMRALQELPGKLKRERVFARSIDARYWIDLFHHVKSKNIDTWDAQWLYSILNAGGVCIVPKRNLVDNIGFDADATHTKKGDPNLPPAEDAGEPLMHPQTIKTNAWAEKKIMDTAFINTTLKRIKYTLEAALSFL